MYIQKEFFQFNVFSEKLTVFEQIELFIASNICQVLKKEVSYKNWLTRAKGYIFLIIGHFSGGKPQSTKFDQIERNEEIE